MRKALNENPKVQIVVLAVVGVIFAVLLFTTVLSGEDEVAPPPAAVDNALPAPGTPAPADPAAPVDPVPSADPAAGSAPAPAPSAAGSDADGLLPSKGLPEDVLVAYARNKAITLLVIDPKGIADKQVRTYVEKLRSRGDVKVFVVKAKDIAKYSRITEGVSVSQTPALIVIRPRDKSGDVRTATVSYGFRGSKSIDIAVEDALYTGKTRSAAP